jgi:hypothetical protein
VEIAIGLHLDVKETVTGKKGQHVIQKADAGADLGPPAAVQVDSNIDLRLFGLAFNLPLA